MTLRFVKPYLYCLLSASIPCIAWKGAPIAAQKQFSRAIPLGKRFLTKKTQKKRRKKPVISQAAEEDLHTLLNLVLVCLLMLAGIALRRLWRGYDSSIPLPHPYDSDHKEYARKVRPNSAEAKEGPAP